MSDDKPLRWVKLFEVDGEQVLFYLEPDNDYKQPREMLHQVVRIEGTCTDIKVGGITLDLADKVFAGLNEASAKYVIRTVRDLLSIVVNEG